MQECVYRISPVLDPVIIKYMPSLRFDFYSQTSNYPETKSCESYYNSLFHGNINSEL